MSENATSSSILRNNMAGSLATAFATPALFLTPLAALAQSGGTVSELAPVQVQGQSESYDAKYSASDKFTAPLLDTAKSVQVIPKAIIEDQAASSLTDVLRNSPGITFGAGEGGNPLGDRPFIRGYDSQASTFVDGLRDIGASSREVFNLEQVEVIKGSDGAYGGRGGAGGSINLISKTAKPTDFTNASLGIGTDSYYRGTLDSNWRLGDNTAFRLNGMYHSADIAGRNMVDNKRWGIAPTITFGLGSPTRVTLSYYHLQTDDTPDSGIPYAYPSTWINDGGANRAKPGYNANRRSTGPANVARDTFYGLASDYRKTTSDMATLGIEHDLSDTLTVRNTTRYTKSDQRYVWTQPDDSQGNVLNGLVWRRANTRVSDVESIANQTELVGEATTGMLKHRFNVGLEFSRERGSRDSLNVNRGAGSICARGIGAASQYNCTSLYDPNPNDPWVNTLNGGRAGNPTDSGVTTKSLYAFDSIEFNKQWHAGIGLRVDDYTSSFKSSAFDMRSHDTLFNYQLGLVYKPVENGSIYVSYATSSTPFNASAGEGTDGSNPSSRGGNVTGGNANQLAPEENRTYEIGTKWDVLNKSMTLSAALFRTETRNARVTLANGDYAMAGSRHINGLELGFSGAITPRWEIFGGYTYLDSKLANNGPRPADAQYEGNQFPNTPKHSFSLWSSYKVTSDFTLGAGAYYVGKQYGNVANTASIPSYWRFDAMAGYRFNKHANVQLNVFNVFNKTYYDKAYTAHYVSVAPGRSAILNLNLSY